MRPSVLTSELNGAATENNVVPEIGLNRVVAPSDGFVYQLVDPFTGQTYRKKKYDSISEDLVIQDRRNSLLTSTGVNGSLTVPFKIVASIASP